MTTKTKLEEKIESVNEEMATIQSAIHALDTSVPMILDVERDVRLELTAPDEKKAQAS